MSDRFLPANGPEEREYLATLGRMVLAWNTAEAIVKTLLELWATERAAGSKTFHVMTAELGTTGLINALRALAHLDPDHPLSEMTLHTADHFSLLRAHRNYYVHAISYLAPDRGNIVGKAISISARGKLIQHIDDVTIAKLDEVSQWCADLSAYVMGTLDALAPLRIPGVDTPAPPQKPPLPPQTPKTASPYWPRTPGSN